MQQPPAAPRHVVDAVTHPDPYPYYARLVAERPLIFDSELGAWIVTRAELVETCLRAPALGVRPPGAQTPAAIVGSASGEVFQRLARMNDGASHAFARRAIEAGFSRLSPAAVDATARHTAATLIERDGACADGYWLDRFVAEYPVGVVARLTGVPTEELTIVVRQALAFVAGIRPGAPVDAIQRGHVAASALIEHFDVADRAQEARLLLARAGEQDGAVAVANTIGLLMQTYEATAALIANAVERLSRHPDAPEGIGADYLREVARFDAPVQNTRRFVQRDWVLDGRPLRAGEELVLVLAAANRDPAVNPQPHCFDPGRADPRIYGWGLGPHQCPGMEMSLAIAAAGVQAIGARIRAWDRLPPARGYAPLSNVRLPLFAT